MAGSWIGLAVAALPFLLLFLGGTSPLVPKVFEAVSRLNPVHWWVEARCREPGCGWISAVSNLFVYFLYGWGAHCALRRLMRRRPGPTDATAD